MLMLLVWEPHAENQRFSDSLRQTVHFLSCEGTVEDSTGGEEAICHLLSTCDICRVPGTSAALYAYYPT